MVMGVGLRFHTHFYNNVYKYKRIMIMPVKYSILSSHADAKPKAGTKTSTYPKSKGKKHSSGKAHERKESKSERKMEYGY
jgi:hypothetical protein